MKWAKVSQFLVSLLNSFWLRNVESTAFANQNADGVYCFVWVCSSVCLRAGPSVVQRWMTADLRTKVSQNKIPVKLFWNWWCKYCYTPGTCSKFGQYITANVIKIVLSRCQLWRLKCTKFNFAPDPMLTALS